MKIICSTILMGILLIGCNDSKIRDNYQNGSLESNEILKKQLRTKVDNIETIDIQISNSLDDVEERSDGSVYVNSSDLELIKDGSKIQSVGLRFNNIAIPKNSTIINAYIQFSTDESTSEATNLKIYAQNSDNAQEFTSNNSDVTSRIKTSSINWNVDPWNSIDEQGVKQQTPNLASLVQMIIDKDGWNNGNSIAFIIDGSGKRVAKSFDGDSTEAPILHIEYTMDSAPNSPSDLFFTNVTKTSVTLNWKDNSDNESGFKIYRDDKLIYITEANVQKYTDNGLQPKTKYRYIVKATTDEEHTDIVAPVITLNGQSTINLIQGDSYSELGAKAIDNWDGDVTDSIEISGNVNTASVGTYTITYKVVDRAGNESRLTRTVIVNEVPPPDTTPPVITLNGDSVITLNQGATYQEYGAKAIDDTDGDISEKIQVTGSVNSSVVGTYTITYKVSDAALNEATLTRKVIVTDEVQNSSGVIINEVLVANTYTNYDPEYSSWIELKNTTNHSINIGGFYLSDKIDEPLKWKIPSGTSISANGYILIWADKEDNGLHTNFKLDTDGEAVVLSDASGKLLSSIVYPEQKGDISFSKIDGQLYYMTPTPNSKNKDLKDSLTLSKKPKFSKESGFYSGTQSIELTQKNGGTIYYTTDGSIPTKSSSIYHSPIVIDKTTVIRARALEDGKFLSSVKSRTYLIDEDITLPVVSIAVDEKYLYGDEGIYTNYREKWMKPASVEYIKDGESKFSENVGLRLFGNYSRRSRAQKSFAIFAKDKYGKKSIDYKLFPEKKFIKKVKSFILRNSGGDKYLLMKDALTQAIIRDKMDIDYQSYHPVITFLNGEYWGILNVREKLNEDYAEANHNVDSDKVVVLGCYGRGHPDLDSFAKSHDMSIEENYKHVIDQIDLDEYINYFLVEMFIDNRDWPGNNLKYWKEDTKESKWRWMIFDTDDAYGVSGGFFKDDTFDRMLTTPMSDLLNQRSPLRAIVLFRGLMENENFKNLFFSRFLTHINLTFQADRISSIIDELKKPLIPEIERHFERWHEAEHISENYSLQEWSSSVDKLKRFTSPRRDKVIDLIYRYINKSGSRNLKVENFDNGMIYIDGIKLTKDYEGVYFNSAKVTLKAVAEEGYSFEKWVFSDGEVKTEQEITISLKSDVSLRAEFVSTVAPKIVINEINYKSAKDFDVGDWIEIYNNDNKDIDISGWKIKDDKEEAFVFPENSIIRANSYKVIVESSKDFLSKFPEVEIAGEFPFGLGKKGDAVRVFDNHDVLVDKVFYDETFPDASGNGMTLSLIDPNLDNSLSSSWKAIKLYGSPAAKNE